MSRSSVEVGYQSLVCVVFELVWLKSLLSKLHFKQAHAPMVWFDNLIIVLLSANPVLHAQMKHIELDLFFVREKVARREVDVRHILANAQVADVLTKPVAITQFLSWRDKLHVEELTALKLKGSDRIRA